MHPLWRGVVVLVSVLGQALPLATWAPAPGRPRRSLPPGTSGRTRGRRTRSSGVTATSRWRRRFRSPLKRRAGPAGRVAVRAGRVRDDDVGVLSGQRKPGVEEPAAAQVVDLEGDYSPRAFPLFYRRQPDSWWRWRRRGRCCANTIVTAASSSGGVHGAAGVRCDLEGDGRRRWRETHRPGRTPCWQRAAIVCGKPPGQRRRSPPSPSPPGRPRRRAVSRDDAAVAVPTRTLSPGPSSTSCSGGPVTTTRPGLPPSGGVQHDHVGLVVEGRYASPNYLSATPGSSGCSTTA